MRSRQALIDMLTHYLAEHDLWLMAVNAAVATTLTNNSTVAAAVAGELTDIPRVQVNDSTDPLTVTYNTTTERAEATIELDLVNTDLVDDAIFRTFVIIADGTGTTGNTAGYIHAVRPLYAVDQVLPADSTLPLRPVTLFEEDVPAV